MLLIVIIYYIITTRRITNDNRGDEMEHKQDRLLSTNEVAERLHIHPNTVRNMLRDGRLQAIKTRGRTGQYRFRQSDVDLFLESEGEVELFEPSFPVQVPTVEAVIEQVEPLDYLSKYTNPFHIFGSYLEPLSPERYSKELTGKAAIWVEESLRQIQLHLSEYGFASEMMKQIGVGVSLKKDRLGKWFITCSLIFKDNDGIYILDGTLQQFHPELDKGLVLIDWADRDSYYIGFKAITQDSFHQAIRDSSGRAFKELVKDIKRQ